MNISNNEIYYKRRLVYIIVLFLIIVATVASTYAFFQYTRTGGNNIIETSQVRFSFIDGNSSILIGNAEPIDSSQIDENYEIDFSIQAHTTLTNGTRYYVYAIYGDEEEEKTRLLDDVMSLQFTPAENGDGFNTTINNYSTAKTPQFINGKSLISTGLVKNTTELTTKDYNVKLWIDSSKIFVSSTVKRGILAEGNPSMADATSGNATVDRYIKNDNNLVSTTVYPANENQTGKIIYTTNEFSTSYYSIKILVEAYDANADEVLVYFDSDGGDIDTQSKIVTKGSAYNLLPQPTKNGYTFLGWKLNAQDVSYIQSNTTVTQTGDHSLIAIWQTNNS